MIARSPITQPGGKYYSVKHILPAFPAPDAYKTYVEVFGGTGVLMLNKPPYNHLEVFNDANGDLINWWMQCRNHPEELREQVDSLPYSRQLYEQWQASLFDGTEMGGMERAVRWFYVLRNSVGCVVRKSKGNWGYEIGDRPRSAITFRSVSQMFQQVSQRFSCVQIEYKDFEHIIKTYERLTTFFYCDPPYIDAEYVYEGLPFTESDHRHLATLLNKTPAMVALSYYPHPLIDELYPLAKWRRLSWQVYKSVEKTAEARQKATELLLCNYPAQMIHQSLWTSEPVA